jgi:hypothetical protein
MLFSHGNPVYFLCKISKLNVLTERKGASSVLKVKQLDNLHDTWTYI